MKYLWSLALGLTFVGCMPQEMTSEEELSRPRAQKTKNPEQWHKPRKLTSAEANQQHRKLMEMEDEFRQQRITTLSRY
jgi:hypothetical protein